MTGDEFDGAFLVVVSKLGNTHYEVSVLADVINLRDHVRSLVAERDMWKRRAAQHGCNIEEGDHECG